MPPDGRHRYFSKLAILCSGGGRLSSMRTASYQKLLDILQWHRGGEGKNTLQRT